MIQFLYTYNDCNRSLHNRFELIHGFWIEWEIKIPEKKFLKLEIYENLFKLKYYLLEKLFAI